MKRNTIQRALTLRAVQKLQNHPTADEVYETVIQKQPTVSRTTVYRNLNELAESGAIRKLETPDGADRFDHRCDEHYHVRCLKCSKVFDVEMDSLPDLQSLIKDKQGFTFIGCDLMFKGICPDCSRKEKSNK